MSLIIPTHSSRPFQMGRTAIFGASRGLGQALVQKILKEAPSIPLWLNSRSISPTLADSQRVIFPADLTRSENFEPLIGSLEGFDPERIIYCAGGGPYGPYQERPWHSHEWALRLNLLFPSQLIHYFLKRAYSKGPLSDKSGRAQNSKKVSTDDASLARPIARPLQMIFIGSAIAENRADPFAASYASSKHGLYGLLRTLNTEMLENPAGTPAPHLLKGWLESSQKGSQKESQKRSQCFDLRLYSPSYMDTSLLPKNSRPRQDDSKIAPVDEIADDLLRWALRPSDPTLWHRQL